MSKIWSVIEQQAGLDRPKIAIGVLRDTEEIRQSLALGHKYADIIVVGTQIEGYQCQVGGRERFV